MRLLANDWGPATVSTANGLSSCRRVLDAADDLALRAVIPRPQMVTGAISFQSSLRTSYDPKGFNFMVFRYWPDEKYDEKSCYR